MLNIIVCQKGWQDKICHCRSAGLCVHLSTSFNVRQMLWIQSNKHLPLFLCSMDCGILAERYLDIVVDSFQVGSNRWSFNGVLFSCLWKKYYLWMTGLLCTVCYCIAGETNCQMLKFCVSDTEAGLAYTMSVIVWFLVWNCLLWEIHQVCRLSCHVCSFNIYFLIVGYPHFTVTLLYIRQPWVKWLPHRYFTDWISFGINISIFCLHAWKIFSKKWKLVEI